MAACSTDWSTATCRYDPPPLAHCPPRQHGRPIPTRQTKEILNRRLPRFWMRLRFQTTPIRISRRFARIAAPTRRTVVIATTAEHPSHEPRNLGRPGAGGSNRPCTGVRARSVVPGMNSRSLEQELARSLLPGEAAVGAADLRTTMRLYDRHIAHAERLRRQLASGVINRREYFTARAVMRAKFEEVLKNG